MMMRYAPEKYGLRPDGVSKEEAASFAKLDTDERYADTTFTVKEAIRTTTYWKYVDGEHVRVHILRLFSSFTSL